MTKSTKLKPPHFWTTFTELQTNSAISAHILMHLVEDKAIPLQPWTGPEGSRRLRLPDFKKVGT
jgi:hypothetical protein